MHLVRPIRNPQRPDHRKHFGQRKIRGNTSATVHLNCLIDDLQSCVRNRDFDL